MKLKSLALTLILLLYVAPFTHAQKDSDEKPFTTVEQMPRYVGGEAEMQKFLSKELSQYIDRSTDTIKSRVVARFVVGSDGVVKECRILKSNLERAENNKICKTIRSMPRWTPGKQNNRPVPVYFTLPVIYYTSQNKSDAAECTNLGDNFFRNGEYWEAKNKYQEAIALDPTNSRAQQNYAATLNTFGKYDEAIKVFEEQSNIAPDQLSASAYNNWGEALMHTGLAEEAITKYEKALELNPTMVAAVNNWALTLYNDAKYKEALDKLDSYLNTWKIDESDIDKEVYVLWGNTYLKLENYPRAIYKYESAIEKTDITDNSIQALYSVMGYALMMNEQYDESIEYLIKTLDINKKNTTAYKNWARCLIKTENKKEAAKKLETALKIDPTDDETITMLANLYIDMGQKEKGQKLLKTKIRERGNY